MLLGHRRTLSRLHARTGRIRWEHATDYGYYPPAPVIRAGSVWVPNAQPDQPLVRLRLADGRVERRVAAAGVSVNWSVAGDRL